MPATLHGRVRPGPSDREPICARPCGVLGRLWASRACAAAQRRRTAPPPDGRSLAEREQLEVRQRCQPALPLLPYIDVLQGR